MKQNMKIVFFGAGAIGQSVGGWIAPHHDNLYFLDRGDVARNLKEKGITLFEQDKKGAKSHVTVKVIDDISEAKDADVIALGVKNFSLDAVAKTIRDKVGDGPVIIAMQNGVENQKVLPKYFSKVVYCVIGYNAWIDGPGVVGYQKKGPLVLGTRNNELMDEMKEIAAVFNRGVETIVVDHIQDAAHSKVIINLTNSLTTLIGHGFRPVSDEGLFQKLLTNLLYEGTQIAKAAGYRECKIGGMPPWLLMKLGATLPRFLTRGMFRKNARKMVMSSMAQDIIQRGGRDSELETINGYMVGLAETYNVNAPYNRAIYGLCKREFSREKFVPLDVRDVWAEVSAQL
ncbi:MAG TPA: 2-dehydropantoate 2-reductase [Spirochaetota bacterium]|nr:2-dehydropantoate 2-reductase [Spirochaetota bacterium]HPC42849.1 2-dehydropantoate 2-reductase [Spirochaetota bacterium]HPL16774.1 2-dehydropantoate 2-reductase [Spirochaetota bacterium]HRS78528.1 2-dehydropantoate 2-reductase [Spirochaetota bacterium]HRT77007.1 2-dehydropantoate 2-reductase [Spirochaetota bacterium]